MPHYIPSQVILKNKLESSLSERCQNIKKVYVSLTLDIEQDYAGITNTSRRVDKATRFLEHIDKLGAYGPLTMFVQGDLVEQHAFLLKELKLKGFDIGLHGFHHELWGNYQWYLREEPISLSAKKNLVELAHKIFEDAGLGRPTMFRAPYLVIDYATVKLLEKYGFEIDSSQQAHLGSPPMPSFFGRLTRIPVSANPLPIFTTKFGLPYTRFISFNMRNVVELSSDFLLNNLKTILAFQMSSGIIPHLIFLAHSWEFFDQEYARHVNYCSASNFELLHEKLGFVANELDITYIKMSELHKLFASSNKAHLYQQI